jgi:hydroxymethylglutaryl-CoA lyase
MAPIVVHEVGMRDGLQMERRTVPTDLKAAWLERLIAAGLDMVQVGSFVHPGKVPQMADTDELFRRLLPPGGPPPRTVLSALVLNEKGLERALACGVPMLCMGVSASETHSRKNTGMTVDEATRRIVAMARRAVSEGRRVQVSVQSAFGCGYEGEVPRKAVLTIVGRFLEADLTAISLADTAGRATPEQVEALYGSIFELARGIECACHFHDTYGLGLANCYAALKAGVRCFESSVAGLGGCPFTAVAGGNVCTEDLVHYLQRTGARREIDLDALIALAREVAAFFDRDMPGRVYRTGPIREGHAVAGAKG